MIPKTEKKGTEKKTINQIPHRHIIQQNISKSNPSKYKNNTRLNRIFPGNASLIQYLEISVIYHLNSVKKKNYIIVLIDAEKHLTKYGIIHNKNSQPTKNERKIL